MSSLNRPVDISPNHLDTVLDILHKHLPANVKVWVFGSRADWTTRDSSDLDLALQGDSALDYDTIMGLEVAFEQSSLPYKVDVVDLKQVSNRFRSIVEAQKVPLYFTNRTSWNKNWRIVRLGDLINIIRGRSYRSAHLQDSVTALVTLKSFNRNGGYREGGLKPYTGHYDKDQVIYPNDMVIAQTDITQSGDVIGRPAIIPDSTSYSTLVASLDAVIIKHKPKNNLDPLFLYYRLLANDYVHHAKSHSTGTTVLHMHKDGINEFIFSLPKLDEQSNISRILKTLDDKINLNRRMSLTLEKMAWALFKSWFVDFDPVRAKMEGRWRRGDSLPGLPAELYNAFPERLVDSDLGNIPEGWEVRALDEIATFLNGLALQKYPANDGPSLPVIKIAQLRAGSVYRADLASRNIPKQYQIHDGDVLFSWSGSLVLDIWTGGEGALNQHLFKVESVDYPKWLYYHSIRQHLADFRDIASDKATTMGHIQRRHIHEAKIAIPNNLTLDLMSKHLQPLLDRSQNLRIESRTLVNQRDELLPKLMSGGIRVRKFAERVA